MHQNRKTMFDVCNGPYQTRKVKCNFIILHYMPDIIFNIRKLTVFQSKDFLHLWWYIWYEVGLQWSLIVNRGLFFSSICMVNKTCIIIWHYYHNGDCHMCIIFNLDHFVNLSLLIDNKTHEKPPVGELKIIFVWQIKQVLVNKIGILVA